MSQFEATDGLRIIVVRPGQTELDEQGRITGSLDVPLSELGQKQISDLSTEFTDLDLSKIVCGPGSASLQTAEILARDKSVKIKIEEELRNFDCGLWHGMRIEELRENQPKLFKLWQEQPQTVQPPDGDSLDDAFSRVEKIVRKLTKKPKTQSIIIVAAEPIACMLRSVLESEDVSKYWTVESNCGSWFEVVKRLQAV